MCFLVLEILGATSLFHCLHFYFHLYFFLCDVLPRVLIEVPAYIALSWSQFDNSQNLVNATYYTIIILISCIVLFSNFIFHIINPSTTVIKASFHIFLALNFYILLLDFTYGVWFLEMLNSR